MAVDVERCHNFPLLLRHNATHHGDDVAMREKDFGIWVELTWQQCYARCRAMALGLVELGVGRGDVVAIIGDNRPDWVLGEIAAHAIGARSLGIYRDSMGEEVEYLINITEARVAWVEDEEQYDKLLDLGDTVPSLQYVVYSDPRGMSKYDDARLRYVEDVIALGEKQHAAAKRFDELIDSIAPDAAQILCTTSGTTSKPKIAVLHPSRVLHHCVDYLAVDLQQPGDNYVSVLPLPWIMEQIYVLGKALISRMVVNFVEDHQSLMSDLREIGPNFILLAPRVWESFLAEINARMVDSTRLNRWLYHALVNRALAAHKRGEKSVLAEWLLMRWLRDHFGLSKVTSAATGGAAMGEDTYHYFLAMGIPLRQLYGQTELCGAYTIHLSDDIDIDTVGLPFKHSEFYIDAPDDEGIGEVCAKTAGMFSGYVKNEAAYRQDTTNDGFLRTGDAGYVKEGNRHLVVIDRVSDLCRTADGLRFSPQYIENKLKFSQYISEAVVIGDNRDYLSALLCIRYATVGKWAEQRGIAFTNYTNLAANRHVAELMREEMQRINTRLNLPVKRFILLYKELDADDEEVTRTRKIRRAVIAEKYAHIIDALYGDDPSVHVDTMIAYQDGSRSRIVADMDVITLQ